LRIVYNNPLTLIVAGLRAVRPRGRLPRPPSAKALLEELSKLPVSTWRYKWEDPEIRHLGPMAQDFGAAFGLGENERWINTTDANGVSFVAIQELVRRLKRLEAQFELLRAETARLPRAQGAIGDNDDHRTGMPPGLEDQSEEPRDPNTRRL
jgi:hypothetical protein